MSNISKSTELIFNKWKSYKHLDKALKEELLEKEHDNDWIKDAFSSNLSFGTGGLRGILGVGSNRMNIYTVCNATLGFSKYLLSNYNKDLTVAIAYDTRINSKLFAEISAKALGFMGIKTLVFNKAVPTPTLCYAIRELKADAGIVITASHNPKDYNGYKIYDSHGSQIGLKAASEITKYISTFEILEDFPTEILEDSFFNQYSTYIGDDFLHKYVNKVSKESIYKKDNNSINIVYTPLNGTGLEPVTLALKNNNFNNVFIVKEQTKTDGLFLSSPKPNPELLDSYSYAIKLAKQKNAQLIIATDPDCDRCGVCVLHNNEYKLLTGNEVGILLFDFICKEKIKNNSMPLSPVAVKSVVTTNLIAKIARYYKVKIIDVLTGFKFIGEQINIMEKNNCSDSFILGLEESCGYLSGTYIRDKDGVDASLLISQMAQYYYDNNMTLIDGLHNIYSNYGYSYTKLCSFEFCGFNGNEKMKDIMNLFRGNISKVFSDFTLINTIDYLDNSHNLHLPKTDMIAFFFDKEISLILRPSGTEPKLKAYIECINNNGNLAKNYVLCIEKLVDDIIRGYK